MDSGSANLTLDGKPAEASPTVAQGHANRVILQGKYGESFITQNKDKPFFLYLSLFGPASRSSRSPTRIIRTSPNSTIRTTTIGGTIDGAWAWR